MAKIVLAVDEPFFYTSIRDELVEDHIVRTVRDLPELNKLLEEGVDLVIMTVPLALEELYDDPDYADCCGGFLAGFALAKDLRSKGDKTPIIWFDTGIIPPVEVKNLPNVALFDFLEFGMVGLERLIDQMLVKAKSAGA